MNTNKYVSSPVRHLLILVSLILLSGTMFAQEEVYSRDVQKVGNTFESVWLIDNQTVLVPLKGIGEFDIIHRFGPVNNGYEDFFGLYAPSNIRIGLSYVPINNLMIGFGFTKERLLWDFHAKYAILKQDGDIGFPLDVTYFVNTAVDTRGEDNFRNNTDRLSYFHQLMVARKVTRDFSVQASINLSHFNRVEAFINSDLEIEGLMANDHLSFSVLGRYKISDAFSFIANYDQPITKHLTNNPNPNISVGIEIATPLHAFQAFFGNYQSIVPQYNNVFNGYDFMDGQFLIGFNITRLMDFEVEDMGGMIFGRKDKKKDKDND